MDSFGAVRHPPSFFILFVWEYSWASLPPYLCIVILLVWASYLLQHSKNYLVRFFSGYEWGKQYTVNVQPRCLHSPVLSPEISQRCTQMAGVFYVLKAAMCKIYCMLLARGPHFSLQLHKGPGQWETSISITRLRTKFSNLVGSLKY